MRTTNDRPGKGHSIIDFPEEYVVVDLETTGLSTQWDSIIEISAILCSDDNPVRSFSELVYCDYIDEYITSLTGITNEMAQAARKLQDVVKDFSAFIGDKILVGHNVNFDINFLYDAFKGSGEILSNNFIDTMRISRKLFPDKRHHRLVDMAELYGFTRPALHRGLDDCVTAHALFLALKRDALAKYGSSADFAACFSAHGSPNVHALNARSLSATNQFDLSHPLYRKTCVFTGALESMTRNDAMRLVVEHGGFVNNSVTKSTDYLIMGSLDYCKSLKGGKSAKQKKAEDLRLKGQDITVIDERTFFELLSTDS